MGVEKVRDTEKLFMIRSEYEKLEVGLRDILDAFIDEDKVEYIQEFKWKIEGDDFKEFMELSPQQIGGTEYKGPSFECNCSNHETGKEEKVLIRPQIYRIDTSFPQHCSVGMTIESVPSGQGVDFWWSSSVKEVGYYSGREYAHSINGKMNMNQFEHSKIKNWIKSMNL